MIINRLQVTRALAVSFTALVKRKNDCYFRICEDRKNLRILCPRIDKPEKRRLE